LTSLGTVGGNFAQFLKRNNYTSFDSHTYIKLKAGTNAKALEENFQKWWTPTRRLKSSTTGKSWADYKKAGNGYVYTLQPLTAFILIQPI